jgi:NADH-quinone oxidoreductase subunit N
MSLLALLALSPHIIVTLTAIAVMLAVARKSDARLAFYLTVAGLLLALSVLPPTLKFGAVQATALMRIDAYALYCGGGLILAALAAAWLCRAYFRGAQARAGELFVLLLTALLGGMILVASDHFAIFFLGLEILSVSLFPMIAYRVERKASLEAGIKYLMLSGVASAFLLFGMALVYGEFGVLSFRELGNLSEAWAGDPLAVAGLLLMLAALGFKLSLTPFHLWTPDVYQGAPAPVTAFLAMVSKGAVFAFLVRFWIVAHIERVEIFLDVLALLGGASILAGNLLALLQTDLKRLLAYSSIAHMGYLAVGVVAAGALRNEFLAETMGVYLASYMLANLGALGVVSALSGDDEEEECARLSAYRGLFRRDPWLAGILAICLLSLAGIPLTLGFIGKFYVFALGVDAELWPLVGAVVVGSGLGIYYYLRVLALMLGEEEGEAAMSAPVQAKWLLTLPVALLLWTGLFPQSLMQALQAMAQSLP